MRTLTREYLGGDKVVEDKFKVDFAVLDRYQAFTTEVLRLTLLGLAGYGFLISNVVFRALPNNSLPYLEALSNNQYLWAGGVVALGLASASALAHRYFSTDCMTHFVRRIRLSERLGSVDEPMERTELERTIVNEENSLTADLRKCHFSIVMACGMLGIGIAAFAAACVRILFV